AHLRIGSDVRDERAHDLEPVAAHRLREPALDVLRDVVLRLEGRIQRQPRQRGADGVEDIGADLLLGVRQAVVGVGDVVLFDDVLDGDRNGDEDVVLRLRLDVDLELLDAQRDRLARRLDQGHLEVQPRLRDLLELPEPFDDDVLLRLHREEQARAQLAEQQNGDDEDNDDYGDGDRESSHGCSYASCLSAAIGPLMPPTLMAVAAWAYGKDAGDRFDRRASGSPRGDHLMSDVYWSLIPARSVEGAHDGGGSDRSEGHDLRPDQGSHPRRRAAPRRSATHRG